MSRYFVNKLVEQPRPLAVLFHREWLNRIRRQLGSKCIFLSHVTQEKRELRDRVFPKTQKPRLPQGLVKVESDYFVEARFRVKGGTKVIKFKIEGTIDDVSNDNYLDLQQQLLGYARTEKLI